MKSFAYWAIIGCVLFSVLGVIPENKSESLESGTWHDCWCDGGTAGPPCVCVGQKPYPKRECGCKEPLQCQAAAAAGSDWDEAFYEGRAPSISDQYDIDAERRENDRLKRELAELQSRYDSLQVAHDALVASPCFMTPPTQQPVPAAQVCTSGTCGTVVYSQARPQPTQAYYPVRRGLFGFRR